MKSSTLLQVKLSLYLLNCRHYLTHLRLTGTTCPMQGWTCWPTCHCRWVRLVDSGDWTYNNATGHDWL